MKRAHGHVRCVECVHRCPIRTAVFVLPIDARTEAGFYSAMLLSPFRDSTFLCCHNQRPRGRGYGLLSTVLMLLTQR